MFTSSIKRLAFEVEWHDSTASVLRKFFLFYFPTDKSVELYDRNTKKTFLKRAKCEKISIHNLHIGSNVVIFSRTIRIIGFADYFTKCRLSENLPQTFILIKPFMIKKLGEILQFLSHYFYIADINTMQVNSDKLIEHFDLNNGQDIHMKLWKSTVIVLKLLIEDASKKDEFFSLLAKEYSSNGISILKNNMLKYLYCSGKVKKRKIKNSAFYENCSCCVVRPHAVQSNLTASIIYDIQNANFIVSAIEQLQVNFRVAEEFLEVYKGIVSDYSAMLYELQSGPCVVMEIKCDNGNTDVVEEFKKFCGARDPEIARKLHPQTLRAKYGITKVKNAVHCSDLSENGILEVEFFFKIAGDNRFVLVSE